MGSGIVGLADRFLAALAAGGEIAAALFLAGLVGGFGHCAGMCGPFVLSQVLSRLERVPAAAASELKRLAGAGLAPYHLGRLTTYAGLGGLAAGIGDGVEEIFGWSWLAAAFLSAAAALFAVQAARALGWSAPRAAGGGRWSQAFGDRLRPLFARPIGLRGYALGVALGFLPCGLLYGALAAAAAAGGILAGVLAMAAFSLGTVPALIAVGLVGHLAAGRVRVLAARVGPLLLVVNAAFLGYLAWRHGA